MKCIIPEISWHNRDPVLSLDIQQNPDEVFYRLASGGADSHVLIWHMKILPNGVVSAENVSDLKRHDRSVNIVRWSPSGQYLASGDDDANIIIWQQKVDSVPLLEDDNNDKEKWIVFKVLRGHKQDIYDICWSPNSMRLLSGSIDNTSILWDLNKGKMDHIMSDHKGFVQGVTWDPKSQYLATLSGDRIMRIFDTNGKVKTRISKGTLPVPETHSLHQQSVKYFHDDTLKTYFRRLSFSPDGRLIIAPTGCIESESLSKPLYASYVFSLDSETPAAIIPSPDHFTLAVKCCPLLFELNPNGPSPVINLPYRMIIAVATRKAIILYDTQQLVPFAIISNMHYACLTDITWSHDGRVLAVSSIDGYCSLVSFEPNELGVEYAKEESEAEENNILEVSGCEQLLDENLTPSKTEEVAKPKKPSFLEQWTIKTPKSKRLKMENGCNEKTSTNEQNDAIELSDDDKDIKPLQASPKPSSGAKLIAVRRKPKSAASNETDNAKPELNKTPSNAVAKPIEVRRTPSTKTNGGSKTDNTKLTDVCRTPPSNNVNSEKSIVSDAVAKQIEVRKTPSSKTNTPEVTASPKTVAKPIEVRKTPSSKPNTPKDSKTSSPIAKPIEVCKTPTLKSNTPKESDTSNSSAAKPIQTRKRPRENEEPNEDVKSKPHSDAKPIAVKRKPKPAADTPPKSKPTKNPLLQFLKSDSKTPKSSSEEMKTANSADKKTSSSEDSNRAPVEAIVSEEAVQEPWTCENETNDNKTINLCSDEEETCVEELTLRLEDSADDDEPIEHTSTENLNVNKDKSAKKQVSESKNATELEICIDNAKMNETDNAKLGKMDIDEQVDDKNEENASKEKPLIEDKNIQNLKSEEAAAISPVKEKRRIPLITLSSPKNKKKQHSD